MESRDTDAGQARMFIALDLPIEVRDAIGWWGERELRDPALRPARVEGLHVTLAFLGERPLSQVEALGTVLGELGAPAPLLELLDPEPRPRRGPARLYALPAVSPATELLRAGLVEELAQAGLFEPEGRQFWPHVTLARVRPSGRGSRRPMRVERTPGSLPEDLRQPFYGVRVALYRSELQSGGSRYVPLAQVELPGAGRQ